MKRSEMIHKLFIHLSELNARGMPYRDLAKLVLKLVEDQGMLPPPAKIQKKDEVINRRWEEEGNS